MSNFYSDGIANISIRDGVARIDLFSVKPSQESKDTKETLESSAVLYLPIAGLLRLHGQINKAVSEMQEKGLIKKNDAVENKNSN